MRTSTKITAIVGGAALTVATAGVAYAYWSTTGTGTGTAATTAGTASLTFTQTALAAMYPGDSAQPLTVAVKNTATNSAYVSSVKAYITTDKTGCTGADFLLGGVNTGTAANPTSLVWTAADLAANGQANATSTVQFNNTSGVQDACKGAAVMINYIAA